MWGVAMSWGTMRQRRGVSVLGSMSCLNFLFFVFFCFFFEVTRKGEEEKVRFLPVRF